MILEGIITTTASNGAIHIAPMGPDVEPSFDCLLLRPFATAQTYKNLLKHGEGVFHVTDDVLLLAQAALGKLSDIPPYRAAAKVQGFVLTDSCRYFEFRVRSIDDRAERVRIEADVVHKQSMRDFFGFNRAKHAVLEAAILATRTGFLPLAEIDAEYRRLAILVNKTGGSQEKSAFAFLKAYLDEVIEERDEGSTEVEP